MCLKIGNRDISSKLETLKREYTLASGGPYCDCGYKKHVIIGKKYWQSLRDSVI